MKINFVWRFITSSRTMLPRHLKERQEHPTTHFFNSYVMKYFTFSPIPFVSGSKIYHHTLTLGRQFVKRDQKGLSSFRRLDLICHRQSNLRPIIGPSQSNETRHRHRQRARSSRRSIHSADRKYPSHVRLSPFQFF